MRRAVCVLVAMLAVGALVRGQDETYTIKLKEHAGKGQALKVTDRYTGTSHFKITDPDGKVIRDQKEPDVSETVYTEKVLEEGGKRPRKISRVYGKATQTKGNKTTEKPYSGRTLLFQLKEGKYEGSAEGKPEVPSKDLTRMAEDLSEETAKTQALLPKKAVKVGESWALGGKEVARILGGGFPIDPAKSRGKGKLVKAYRKDGKQFGVLEFRLDVVGKSTDEDRSSGVVSVVYDTPIDGSGPPIKESGKAHFDRKGTLAQGGKKLALAYTLDIAGTLERTPAK